MPSAYVPEAFAGGMLGRVAIELRSAVAKPRSHKWTKSAIIEAGKFHLLKMPQVLTVSCQLEVSPQQVEKLDAVLSAFANCCEFVNVKTPAKLTNQIAVQSLIYKEARANCGLSAQMTIHAIRRVCANRKTAKQKSKPVKGFVPTSATYGCRPLPSENLIGKISDLVKPLLITRR